MQEQINYKVWEILLIGDQITTIQREVIYDLNWLINVKHLFNSINVKLKSFASFFLKIVVRPIKNKFNI